jgi:hypothetical protein
MALGIVRYASRWVQPLAVALGVALGLFVLFAPLALNVKNPAPREKDRVLMKTVVCPLFSLSRNKNRPLGNLGAVF